MAGVGERISSASAPRTILGFFWGVFALLVGATAVILQVLATRDSLHHLVPWVLLYVGAMGIALVGVVVWILHSNKTMRLLLGEVSGQELSEHERSMGDSVLGLEEPQSGKKGRPAQKIEDRRQ